MTSSNRALTRIGACWRVICRIPQFGITHYAAVISILVGLGGLYIAKLSYDLSSAKEERELQEKMPAIDVQMRSTGATSAALIISIANRSNVKIVPLDITVQHSFEAGELYLSSAQQSVNLLKTSMSLSRIGPIAPSALGTLKASVEGATDGKDDRFLPGLELQFSVRIRFADEQDTIRTFSVTRRFLPPLAAEPCPPTWTLIPLPTGC
jgi:hypothetical protein